MQRVLFKTELDVASEMLDEALEMYEEYKRRRQMEINSAPIELLRLKKLARVTPSPPMKGGKYIVYVRRRSKPYFRRSPTKPPTPPKRMTWITFAKLVKEAKKKSFEEVARLVGGEVVELPTGGKVIKLPSGEMLPKAAAYVRAMMKGKTFAIPETELERLVNLLKWALE